MKKKNELITVFVLSMLLLSGCSGMSSVKEAPTSVPPVEYISEIVTQESILEFEKNYPALKEADFSGSTCYAAIENYMARNPQVKVQYTISLGPKTVLPDVETLVLESGEYEYPLLREGMKYLHNLRSVKLVNTSLMPDTIRDLQAAYPNISVDYSVNFCGTVIESSTTTCNFSAIAPADAIASAELLTLLPNIREIELMSQDGTSVYSLEDAAQLQSHIPGVLLHYSFRLFDADVSTTDEEVVYTNKSIGNQPGALEQLRLALSIMHGCKRFVLDNCKFDNDTLAAVRDEFRATTNVVWRVWFGEGGCLTDREVIRHVYGLYDSNCVNLKYCEGAKFVDFGHNEYLKNCDFVAGMPNLQAIILSGSMISDLSPFVNCKNLEFLEISYCGYITDISALQHCTNLKRLNIAYTKVDNLEALDQLKLDVFVDARSKVEAEEQGRFDSLHPDCLIQHTGDAKDDQPYGYPWRYDEKGDPNPYYALLKEKFNYPNTSNTLY